MMGLEANTIEWSKLTASELNGLAEDNAIVLVPCGSTEQHGPHLTTGVDAMLCSEACRRTALLVSEREKIVVTPALWMGLAEHHVSFGGTFSLSLRTWHALLEDICRSILRAGFKRICVVNGHGGNMAALTALTTDLARDLGEKIATTSYWSLPQSSGAFAKILETQPGVQHACEAETSMMMASFPDCVRHQELASAAGPCISMANAISSDLLIWREFRVIAPNGVLGDPRVASANKGEALFNAAAEHLARELLEGRPWHATNIDAGARIDVRQ